MTEGQRTTLENWVRAKTTPQRTVLRARIRRGVFKSVQDLVAAINGYIRLNNQCPKPFVWTKNVDAILDKVTRCKGVIETLH